VPALPSCVLEPLWDQVAALLPARHVHHPLGCHRRRIPDRLIFDKLIQVLVFGCGYRRIADRTCSATTPRRRRDEWTALGVAEQLRLLVLAAYDRLLGLDLNHLSIDGCITKAPCGGQTAGPSPVDRRKQGGKRSVVTDATVSCWARFPPRPTAATTRCWATPWIPWPCWGHCRHGPRCTWTPATTTSPVGMSWPAAAWSARSSSAASLPRSRPAGVGSWSAPTPGPTSTASCAGVPSVAGWWCSSGWHWLAPSSSLGGWFAAPGLITGGKAVHDDGRSSYWRSWLPAVTASTALPSRTIMPSKVGIAACIRRLNRTLL
jgi:transposase